MSAMRAEGASCRRLPAALPQDSAAEPGGRPLGRSRSWPRPRAPSCPRRAPRPRPSRPRAPSRARPEPRPGRAPRAAPRPAPRPLPPTRRPHAARSRRTAPLRLTRRGRVVVAVAAALLLAALSLVIAASAQATNHPVPSARGPAEPRPGHRPPRPEPVVGRRERRSRRRHPGGHPADHRAQRADRERRLRRPAAVGPPRLSRRPAAAPAEPSHRRTRRRAATRRYHAATRRRARAARQDNTAATRRHPGQIGPAGTDSGLKARAACLRPPSWSTVTTTSSSYIAVVFPQVVLSGRITTTSHPGEVIACTARSAAIRTAGSSTAGPLTTVPRSAAGGRAPSAGAGSPRRRRSS